MADESCEVLVLGGGMAGLTAALFSARSGRATRVLCPEGPGGPLVSIEQIEDFPGFTDPVAGYELCPILQEQAQHNGAAFEASTIKLLESGVDGSWSANTDAGVLGARAVIVATGTVPRGLQVPGESELLGRGISHCASCDGPLYRDRDVAVVGNGDPALSEALTLARCGTRVTMLFEEDQALGQETYRRRVADDSAISLRPNSSVLEIRGDSTVAGIVIKGRDGARSEVSVDAVFVYAGRLPATEFLGDTVEFGIDGRIRTDISMRTSAPGIFAAGDVRFASPGFAVSAAGDGAVAALSAASYLAEHS